MRNLLLIILLLQIGCKAQTPKTQPAKTVKEDSIHQDYGLDGYARLLTSSCGSIPSTGAWMSSVSSRPGRRTHQRNHIHGPKIKIMSNVTDFLELHTASMHRGFWAEEYRSLVIKAIESRYKTDIIREYGISDFVSNGDKVLVKWVKRIIPLSDQQLKDDYGRDDV